eukprot:jgi/Chlat1/6181/Chrsp42S05736
MADQPSTSTALTEDANSGARSTAPVGEKRLSSCSSPDQTGHAGLTTSQVEYLARVYLDRLLEALEQPELATGPEDALEAAIETEVLIIEQALKEYIFYIEALSRNLPKEAEKERLVKQYAKPVVRMLVKDFYWDDQNYCFQPAELRKISLQTLQSLGEQLENFAGSIEPEGQAASCTPVAHPRGAPSLNPKELFMDAVNKAIEPHANTRQQPVERSTFVDQQLSALYRQAEALSRRKDRSAALRICRKMEASFINKRRTDGAHLVLVGRTQSGKSSTVNFWCGMKGLLPEGDGESCTVYPMEVVGSREYQHGDLGSQSLKLNVLDTPGFLDTGGPETDAINICRVRQYLHDQHFDGQTCFPSVVLVVFDISESTPFGRDGQYTKVVRMLTLLEVVDVSTPNIILVFNKAWSPRDAQKQYDDRNKWPRLIEKTKLLVADTLRLSYIPCHVLQEAKQSNLDDVTKANPQYRDGQFYKMPDGSMQPRDLSRKIQVDIGGPVVRMPRVPSEDGDPVLRLAAREWFRSEGRANVVLRQVCTDPSEEDVQRTLVQLKGLDADCADKSYWKNILTATACRLNGGPQLSEDQENSIQRLAQALASSSIPRQEVLKNSSMSAIRIWLVGHSFKLDAYMEQLLEHMGVKLQHRFPAHSLLVGKGYDCSTNKALGQVLKLDAESCCWHSILNGTLDFPDWLNVYESRLEYHERQVATESKLQWVAGLARWLATAWSNYRAGIRLDKVQSSSAGRTAGSGRYYVATHEVALKPLGSSDCYPFTPEFEGELQALPTSFQADWRSLRSFQRFFDFFGSHLLQSHQVGGILEWDYSSKSAKDDSHIKSAGAATGVVRADVQASLAASFNKGTIGADGELHLTISSSGGQPPQLDNNELTDKALVDWKNTIRADSSHKGAASFILAEKSPGALLPIYHLLPNNHLKYQALSQAWGHFYRQQSLKLTKGQQFTCNTSTRNSEANQDAKNEKIRDRGLAGYKRYLFPLVGAGCVGAAAFLTTVTLPFVAGGLGISAIAAAGMAAHQYISQPPQHTKSSKGD